MAHKGAAPDGGWRSLISTIAVLDNSEAYNAEKAGHMEPDGVSHCVRRTGQLDQHCISGGWALARAVDVAVDSQQKVIHYMTAVACPAFVVTHTPTTSVRK